MRGIVSVLIGAVMIIGGLTGKMTLRGTHSSGGLVILGIVVIGFGVYRITRSS